MRRLGLRQGLDCPGLCDTQITVEQLVCVGCWWALPRYIRDAVNATHAATRRWPDNPVVAAGHKLAIRRVRARFRAEREGDRG